ncbi:MAG TPA: macro domain-containing protein [Nitrososphaeraceae archaeon]|jgi:O-acetyl-ADP-ribose deacetylase
MSVITEINLKVSRIIRLVKGDITEREVDAIVNAANSYLRHGGGVAAAIVRKGGAIIQQESNKIGFVPIGSAAITTAGKLSCKAIIHAVGPRMGEGDEDNKLRKAVRSSLILASEKGYATISMPAISSGIFGFPKDRCAEILVKEAKRFLEDNSNSTSIETVEFCIIDDETVDYFEKEFANVNKYLIK